MIDLCGFQPLGLREHVTEATGNEHPHYTQDTLGNHRPALISPSEQTSEIGRQLPTSTEFWLPSTATYGDNSNSLPPCSQATATQLGLASQMSEDVTQVPPKAKGCSCQRWAPQSSLPLPQRLQSHQVEGPHQPGLAAHCRWGTASMVTEQEESCFKSLDWGVFVTAAEPHPSEDAWGTIYGSRSYHPYASGELSTTGASATSGSRGYLGHRPL